MNPRWKPNVTVAAVIERQGRFLLVEEETSNGLRLNQPAGHLEAGESLLCAVARETVEETAHSFAPEYLVGIYLCPRPQGDATYLRFAFGGQAGEADPARALDEGIVRTVWMTAEEIRASRARCRSPLVLQCVEDWLSGRRYGLEMLRHYDDGSLS
ncbi:MAG: NUDIX hydrolase [Azoarcus sp.]|jgi:ADP-ribose pyrophosphatase YjhB (NUDIX family)|nr:NUDIX hydrolase [Azoarcus sp.]